MNYKIIVSTIMAMSLGVGNIAYAQDNDRQHGRDRNDQEHRNDRHDRNDRNDRYGHDDRNYQMRSYDEGRHNDRNDGERHRFQRGERLPSEYRGRQYVVEDWRGHRLSAPPRGYHWVQSGSDYVLAAVATGIILQVLLNN